MRLLHCVFEIYYTPNPPRGDCAASRHSRNINANVQMIKKNITTTCVLQSPYFFTFNSHHGASHKTANVEDALNQPGHYIYCRLFKSKYTVNT